MNQFDAVFDAPFVRVQAAKELHQMSTECARFNVIRYEERIEKTEDFVNDVNFCVGTENSVDKHNTVKLKSLTKLQ